MLFFVVYDKATGNIKRAGKVYTPAEVYMQPIDETEGVIQIAPEEWKMNFNEYIVDLNTITVVRK